MGFILLWDFFLQYGRVVPDHLTVISQYGLDQFGFQIRLLYEVGAGGHELKIVLGFNVPVVVRGFQYLVPAVIRVGLEKPDELVFEFLHRLACYFFMRQEPSGKDLPVLLYLVQEVITQYRGGYFLLGLDKIGLKLFQDGKGLVGKYSFIIYKSPGPGYGSLGIYVYNRGRFDLMPAAIKEVQLIGADIVLDQAGPQLMAHNLVL